MRRLVVMLLFALMASAMLVTKSAPAWLQTEGGRWAFGPFTLNGDGKSLDPLTVIFRGDGRSIQFPKTILEEWEDEDGVADRGNMREHKCNRGSQDVKFKHLDRHDPHYVFSKVDYQLSTSSFCNKQFHARVWDSFQHDLNTQAHADVATWFQWAVAAVHHEHPVFDCNEHDYCASHKIDQSWEHVEKVTRKQLEEFCSWANWRRLPGSPMKRWRDFPTNGRLTRISPERVGEPGQCS